MPRHSLDATLERLRRWNRWYEGAERAEAEGLGGVNVCGYLRDESGWGEAGRGYVRALRRLGVPLALLNVSDLSSNRSEDRTLEGFDSSHPYDINLVCVDAGQHFAMMHRVGEEFFEGRYNVGAWAWELPRFPARLYDRFAYYDEIWVGTSFIADALAPVSPVPVVRVPPVLSARAGGSRERGRAALGVGADEFVFLFVFDFHSHLARKNPLALVEAFRLAFGPHERARLVVKCVNGRADPGGFSKLRARAEGHRVDIHDGYRTAEEMRDLFEACDAYASLHRSEGTGLTLSEAMARAKPVVATGWSGNMDFMNVSNSFPVRFRLTEIEETVGPYEAGETWAEPSVEHAAQLMRHVFDQRDDAREVGERARRDIEARYSEEAVAALVGQRLEVVAGRERFADFRRELRAFYFDYRRLVRRIREAADASLPADAAVVVVSKGDEELVQLGGSRRAWHFPRDPDGTYSGHYPATGAAAVAHLEELRAGGAQFLLLPGTALWWLELYADFGAHLDDNYRRVRDDDACVIFDLREAR